MLEKIQKFKKVFVFKKIYNRLTFYFSSLIIVFMVIIACSISYLYSLSIIEQTKKTIKQELNTAVKETDEKMGYLKNFSATIKSSRQIEILLNKELYPGDDTSRKNEIANILGAYEASNDLVSKIIAIDRQDNILDPLYSVPAYRDKIIQDKYFSQFKASNYFNMFSPPTTFPTDYKAYSSLILYSQYLSKSDYKLLGYLLIKMNKDALFSSLQKACEESFDYAFIINRQNELIYTAGEHYSQKDLLDMISTAQKNSQSTVTIDNKKYILTQKVFDNTSDWTMITAYSYEKIAYRIKVINLIILLTGVVTIALISVISYFIAKRITVPIKKINKAMAEFENGNWPKAIECKSEDELKYLTNGFNSMVINIKDLIEKVKVEQEEKKKAEILALRFELEALQYQINPHFIHNTLNAVSSLAMRDHNKDIQTMIEALNLLLRTTMSSTERDYITIREELDCISSYLTIQEYRYGHIMQIVYEGYEELMTFKIPKMLLQPIVENAIYHGIVPKDTVGTIKIVFNKEQDFIHIKVIDDGIGIEKETLKTLLVKGFHNHKTFNNIGLHNVNDRLKLYFGETFKLSVWSEPQKGTCVSFKIPMIE